MTNSMINRSLLAAGPHAQPQRARTLTHSMLLYSSQLTVCLPYQIIQPEGQLGVCSKNVSLSNPLFCSRPPSFNLLRWRNLQMHQVKEKSLQRTSPSQLSMKSYLGVKRNGTECQSSITNHDSIDCLKLHMLQEHMLLSRIQSAKKQCQKCNEDNDHTLHRLAWSQPAKNWIMLDLCGAAKMRENFDCSWIEIQKKESLQV